MTGPIAIHYSDRTLKLCNVEVDCLLASIHLYIDSPIYSPTRYKLIRSNINQLHVGKMQRKVVILQIVLFKIYVYAIHNATNEFMEAEY